jgi:hypothetical protein
MNEVITSISMRAAVIAEHQRRTSDQRLVAA